MELTVADELVPPTIGHRMEGAEDRVTVDVDRVVAGRMLITANSGAGKSWAVRRLLEQTHGHVQHLILDWEGDFGTLRECFDYVLLGANEEADGRIDAHSARVVARKLLELGTSAVINLYDLSPGGRTEFVRDFCNALVNAPKHLWHPAMVVIDEAHLLCPETGKAASREAVVDLCAQGRKRGYAPVLATQRISKLAKDAAAECNTKMIGRAVLDLDAKRAADELGISPQERRLLRDLAPGTFYAFGPALPDLVGVEIIQVGPVETTHPDPKNRSTVNLSPPPTSAALQEIVAALADLPEVAAAEEADLDAMRRRIRELEQHLAESDTADLADARAEVDRLGRERDALAAEVTRRGTLLERAENALRDVQHVVSEYDEANASDADATMPSEAAEPVRAERGPERRESQPPPPRPPSPPASVPAQRQADGIGKAERAVLTVLAQFGPCEAGKLAMLAGYRWSGGFRNTLSTLRTAGHIEGANSGTMSITEGGMAALGTYTPLPTGRALLDYWLQDARLGATDRDVLRYVFERYPEAVSGEDAAAATGRQYSGGFRNSLSRLRTAGLIEGRNASFTASPLFFQR